MQDNCLVCGDERNSYPNIKLKCKMCGMGVIEEVYYLNFIFCSSKCRRFFNTLMKLGNDTQKEELTNKSIVF